MTVTAAPPVATTEQKLQSIISDVSQVIFERDDQLRLTVLTMLADLNLFILGQPGAGKTESTRLLASHFTSANYFQTLFFPNKPPETLFGRLDGAKLANLEMVYTLDGNYLPGAHIFLADEIWKGNPTTHDPMLSILNREGFDNGGTYVPTPLMVAIGISNEMPQSDESMALYDRFSVRTTVDYIASNANFLLMLDRSDAPYVPSTTVDVSELLAARQAVSQVTVPQDVYATILQLRARLTQEGHRVSDRRWRQTTKLLKANAWLDGKTVVDEDDLEWIRFMLWEHPDQIPQVTQVVLETVSPQAAALLGASDALKAMSVEIRQAEGAQPPDSDRSPEAEAQRSEFTKLCAQSIAKLNRMRTQLEDVRDEAQKAGRKTDRANATLDAVNALRATTIQSGMGA